MELIKKMILTLACSTLMLFAFSACEDTLISEAVTGVALDATQEIMEIGDTKILIPTITPDKASDKTVKWESDNETVATVGNDGTVTALAEGTATITVITNNGGFKATCIITVVDPTKPYLIVMPSVNHIFFSIDGQTATDSEGNEIDPVFTVQTNQEAWDVTIEPGSERIHITKGDNNTFTITADANNRFDVVKVTATVEAGSAEPVAIEIEQEAVPTPQVDVYVAGNPSSGQGLTYAAYWKNGEINNLTYGGSNAGATSIYVDNDRNVHVVGYEKVGAYSVPRYWKNGSEITLETDGADRDSQANAVFVHDGTIYIAGYLGYSNGSGPVPVYWRDGDLNKLNTGDVAKGHATSLFVDDDGVVYIGGQIYDNVESMDLVYWKDGLRTVLEENMYTSKINDLYVYEDNLYIVGYGKFQNGGVDSRHSALSWVQDTRTVLINGVANNANAYATSVFVDTTGEYICGYDIVSSSIYTPYYWKNNVKHELTVNSGLQQGTTKSIFVHNNIIYIAGAYRYTYTNPQFGELTVDVPCYWMNGVEQVLDGGSKMASGSATSIFVVDSE